MRSETLRSDRTPRSSKVESGEVSREEEMPARNHLRLIRQYSVKGTRQDDRRSSIRRQPRRVTGAEVAFMSGRFEPYRNGRELKTTAPFQQDDTRNWPRLRTACCDGLSVMYGHLPSEGVQHISRATQVS